MLPTLTIRADSPHHSPVMEQNESLNGFEDNFSVSPPEEVPRFSTLPATRIVSLDENQLREMIIRLREKERFITDLAGKLGVNPQYLGDVISGKKQGGPKLWKALGVVRTYRMFDVEIVWDED